MPTLLRSGSIYKSDNCDSDCESDDWNSDTDMGETQTQVLNKLLHEIKGTNKHLAHISGAMDKLTTEMQTCNQFLKVDIMKHIQESVKGLNDSVAQSISNLTKEVTKIPNKPSTTTSTDIEVESHARREKSEKVPEWEHKLNYRKFEYWKNIKNQGISEIYDKWLSDEDNSFMPRKFRHRPSKDETKDQRKIKEELSRQKMKAEIRLLQSRAKIHLDNYQKTDLEIHESIANVKPVGVSTRLEEMWIEDIKREERISQGYWKEHQEWLEKLPNENQSRPNRYQNGPNTGPQRNYYQQQQSYNRQWNQHRGQNYNSQYNASEDYQFNKQSYNNQQRHYEDNNDFLGRDRRRPRRQ